MRVTLCSDTVPVFWVSTLQTSPYLLRSSRVHTSTSSLADQYVIQPSNYLRRGGGGLLLLLLEEYEGLFLWRFRRGGVRDRDDTEDV